jgi:hypothetical protein
MVSKKTQSPLSIVNGSDYAVDNGKISISYSDGSFILQTIQGKMKSSCGLVYSVTDVSGALSDVVLIDANGKVTINKTGTVIITVTRPQDNIYNAVSTQVIITVNPAISFLKSPSGVCFNLENAVLPKGISSASIYSTISSDSTQSTVEKLIEQNRSLGNLNGLMVYDLKLLDQNGNPITNFTGKIKVNIPIPVGMSGNLKVFWYNLTDDKLTDMGAVKENGYLVFETTHLSYYAIAQLAASVAQPATTPNTSTGDNSIPFSLLALLGLGSTAGLVVVRKSAQYKLKKNSHRA